MRMSTRTLFLLAVLVFVLAVPAPAAQPQRLSASMAGPNVSVQLPGRRLDVSVAITPAVHSEVTQASLTVTVTNMGIPGFSVEPDHFALSAEGDIFGPARAPGP